MSMKEDARKLSTEAQREKRRTAFRMRDNGCTMIFISESLAVHPKTVSGWFKKARLRGKAAVIAGGQRGTVYGAGRTLGADREVEIRLMMADKMPDQLKMPFALWTRDAVRELIRQKYQLDMPIRTVGEYLKRWGFTPQRPLRKAYQQNPVAVKKWLEADYPVIERSAKAVGGEIQWTDETGIRSDHHGGQSYSPKGRTPVREVSGSRFSMNMISSVTNRGKLRFMLYTETMTSAVFLRFLQRLVKDAKGRKIFLILDNLRVHHSREVKIWVKERESLIELFYLPAYSPELNPDEYLNGDMKRRIKTGPAVRNLAGLEKRVRSVMRKIQLNVELVKSYFRHEKVAYAA